MTTTTLHNTQTIVQSHQSRERRYEQPFFIGLKSKCRGVSSDGYLPALEIEEELEPDNDDLKHQEIEWLRRQWNMIQQLRTQVLYLQKRLNEHLDQRAQEKGKERRSGIEI